MVEMLITVAIMGLIIGTAFVNYTGFSSKSLLRIRTAELAEYIRFAQDISGSARIFSSGMSASTVGFQAVRVKVRDGQLETFQFEEVPGPFTGFAADSNFAFAAQTDFSDTNSTDLQPSEHYFVDVCFIDTDTAGKPSYVREILILNHNEDCADGPTTLCGSSDPTASDYDADKIAQSNFDIHFSIEQPLREVHTSVFPVRVSNNGSETYEHRFAIPGGAAARISDSYEGTRIIFITEEGYKRGVDVYQTGLVSFVAGDEAICGTKAPDPLPVQVICPSDSTIDWSSGTHECFSAVREAVSPSSVTVEDRSGQSVGSATFSCTGDGLWTEFSSTCGPPAVRCSSETRNHCILSGAAHSETEAGRCENGYFGVCSYQCDSGTWKRVINRCRVPASGTCQTGTEDSCATSLSYEYCAWSGNCNPAFAYCRDRNDCPGADHICRLPYGVCGAPSQTGGGTECSTRCQGYYPSTNDRCVGETFTQTRTCHSLNTSPAAALRCGPYVREAVGTKADCSSVNAECADPDNLPSGLVPAPANGCKRGIYREVSDTDSLYRWSCDGINGGTSVSICEKDRPQCSGGEIGTWEGTGGFCSGTLEATPSGDSFTIETEIDGIPASATYECNNYGVWPAEPISKTCDKAEAIDGQCNDALADGAAPTKSNNACISGVLNDEAIPDDFASYFWICEGRNEGDNSDPCDNAKAACVGEFEPEWTIGNEACKASPVLGASSGDIIHAEDTGGLGRADFLCHNGSWSVQGGAECGPCLISLGTLSPGTREERSGALQSECPYIYGQTIPAINYTFTVEEPVDVTITITPDPLPPRWSFLSSTWQTLIYNQGDVGGSLVDYGTTDLEHTFSDSNTRVYVIHLVNYHSSTSSRDELSFTITIEADSP